MSASSTPQPPAVPFADLEIIEKQKTSQAIKKLEKQFKATFMAYTSTKEGERQQAHDKLERKPYSSLIYKILN